MTPEYIEQLAKLADPEELWRLSPLTELTLEQSQQRDTGIALRRHASHMRDLNAIRGKGLSLLVTPLSPHGTYTCVMETPKGSKYPTSSTET